MSSHSSKRRGETAKPDVAAAIDLARAEHIGDELKAMFDAVAAEPLPREIEALVEELEERRMAEEEAPRRQDRRS